MNNPHCEWHIYIYNGRRYLVPWGGENQSVAYEIVGERALAETDENSCDISDGEYVETIRCDSCPFAADCCWDDLPEEYAVDNGWSLPSTGYITEDYETGTAIDEFATCAEAMEAIAKYEAADKANGSYSEGFYAIRYGEHVERVYNAQIVEEA